MWDCKIGDDRGYRLAMRIQIHKRRKLLAVLAVPTLLAAWLLFVTVMDLTASFRARLAARFDLARGHYKILGYGLPSPYQNEYARLLQERYAIEYHQAALCIVSKSLRDYVDNYDAVSAAAAVRKFGHDVFKETAQEARTRWNAAHPDMPW